MQGFDVYPLGMGLDLNTYERLGAFDPSFTGSPNGYGRVPALYNAEYLFYRPGGTSASRVSDVALHLYPIAASAARDPGAVRRRRGQNVVGGRPAAIYDLGFLKLRGRARVPVPIRRGSGPLGNEHVNSYGAPAPRRSSSRRTSRRGSTSAPPRSARPVPRARTRASPETGSAIGGFVDVVPFPGIPAEPDVGGGRQLRHLPQPDSGRGGNYERSTNLQWFVAAQYLFYRQLYVKVRRWLREVALRKQGDHDAVRRRHVQPPRPRAVPVLTRLTRER